MASVLTQMSDFFTGSGMQYPVIIRGVAGTDYILKKFKVQTSAQIRIGSLVDIRANYVDQVAYAAHAGYPLGIVPDTKDNKALLQKDNAGVEVTKALTFTAGGYIDVAIPIHDIIVSVEVEESNALEVNSRMEVAGAGIAKVWNDGPVIGQSLGYNTSGTGHQYVAMKMAAIIQAVS